MREKHSESETILRKRDTRELEVIQPHLPVRLPCYDLAPVTGLTFGRSVPCGFGYGLRVLQASMA